MNDTDDLFLVYIVLIHPCGANVLLSTLTFVLYKTCLIDLHTY